MVGPLKAEVALGPPICLNCLSNLRYGHDE